MKVKCYGLFQSDREIVLEFSNPSQKDFLDYQLKTALKRMKKSSKIEFENTANGVWYCRQHPNNKGISQMILLSKESSSVSFAANFFNKAVQMEKSCDIHQDKQKIRIKIADLIRLYNANKIQKLNTNVVELQGIIKGNVNKIVSNMSELDTAQRKSEMMAELSMQFERDSRELEKKMKCRKLKMKILVGSAVAMVLAIIIYILFF